MEYLSSQRLRQYESVPNPVNTSVYPCTSSRCPYWFLRQSPLLRSLNEHSKNINFTAKNLRPEVARSGLVPRDDTQPLDEYVLHSTNFNTHNVLLIPLWMWRFKILIFYMYCDLKCIVISMRWEVCLGYNIGVNLNRSKHKSKYSAFPLLSCIIRMSIERPVWSSPWRLEYVTQKKVIFIACATKKQDE